MIDRNRLSAYGPESERKGPRSYRLLTFVSYPTRIVFIKELLSHAEYDKNAWKKRLDHA